MCKRQNSVSRLKIVQRLWIVERINQKLQPHVKILSRSALINEPDLATRLQKKSRIAD